VKINTVVQSEQISAQSCYGSPETVSHGKYGLPSFFKKFHIKKDIFVASRFI